MFPIYSFQTIDIWTWTWTWTTNAIPLDGIQHSGQKEIRTDTNAHEEWKMTLLRKFFKLFSLNVVRLHYTLYTILEPSKLTTCNYWCCIVYSRDNTKLFITAPSIKWQRNKEHNREKIDEELTNVKEHYALKMFVRFFSYIFLDMWNKRPKRREKNEENCERSLFE